VPEVVHGSSTPEDALAVPVFGFELESDEDEEEVLDDEVSESTSESDDEESCESSDIFESCSVRVVTWRLA
jgi:hypothetical protein